MKRRTMCNRQNRQPGGSRELSTGQSVSMENEK